MTLATPWQIIVVALAGWMNREQGRVLEYLTAENEVLKEKLVACCDGRRIRFTDSQRRRLAAKAMALGRQALGQLSTLVTPDTLLRWHRQLIAEKYDGSSKRGVGRPKVDAETESLVVQLARENPGWGYSRIVGALSNLGIVVARCTVANILKRHGIDPAPARKTTWSEFIEQHWDTVTATDFFTVELWRPIGLVRYHVLFVIELATRRVHIAGIVAQPNGTWMAQIARNLTDAFEGFLTGKRYLIHDRDTLFTKRFRSMLADEGVECVRLPPKSPNLNAFAERFVLSIKSECLDHLILFSDGQLRRAVVEFCRHYHRERNHQGLGNRLIDGGLLAANDDGAIQCRRRLGGLLRYYHREAA